MVTPKGEVSYFVHMYVDNSVNTTLEHLHTGWGSGRLQLLPRFHPLPQLLGELLQASLAVRPLISFDVVGPTSVGRGRGGGGGGEGRGGGGEGREINAWGRGEMERREGLRRVVERGWEKAKGRQLWESVKGTDLQYTTANYISTPSHTHHHTHQ